MQNNNINNIKKSQKQAKILNVRFDSTSVDEVLDHVQEKVTKNEKFYIVTPNPEIVLEASEDSHLAKILNSADISLPDGIGLLAANRFLSLPTPHDPIQRFFTLFIQGLGVGFSVVFNNKWVQGDFTILRGREVFMELIGLADRNGWKVYLMGGESDEAEKAREKIAEDYKNLKIKSSPGPMLDKEGMPTSKKEKEIETETVKQISAFRPQLLFVGIGAPRQEKWMYRWLLKLSVGGAMVVGGTFNYVAGKHKLPPRFIADSGLEWAWRLLTGSQETRRIWRAFPQFALRVFLSKLASN